MHRSLLLLLAGLLLLGSRQVRASHAQGGDLTYLALGNNRYRVTCSYFRDCSGITAETSLTLNCRVGSPVTSCNSADARNFTATLVRGQLISSSPYCASLPGANACASSSPYANYESVRYTADVTLPPAAEWTLSVEISARPSVKNIGGQSNLRYEATLNNQITLPNGTQSVQQNTSPQYSIQSASVPLVCWRQRTTLTFSAFEPDGDSLVYALAAPLEGCNLFSTYAPITGAGGVIVDPSSTPTNPCVIVMPATTTNYSPTFPIFSYEVTGTCPVKTGTPTFNFNPPLGSFTFTPAILANTAPVQGDNKYAVVGQVTEYRKINGRYYKIGSVRRDMLVIVVDCGGNQVPASPTATPGSATVSYDSLVVTSPVGTYTEADFNFSDPNPNDLLTVTLAEPIDPAYVDMHVNPLNPSRPAVVQANGSTTPSLKVRLRPDPTMLGRTYRIPVRVEDNACPIKGVQNYILVLRAVPRATATAMHAAPKPTTLSAYPTPFTEQVRFTLPRPRPGAGAVLIFDQLGRLVDQLPVPASTAAAEATLTWTPAATVPAGVYSARFADGQHTARLVRVAP